MRTTFPVSGLASAWDALANPEVLAAVLPGCRSAQASDGGVQVVVDVAVASVRGLWAGTVVPVDGDAVRIVGSGEPGTVDVVARADPERTTLTVEGTVDGPLAALGSTLLAAAVRRLADDLLSARRNP
jgi:carbon monoxide dehydrogenase subunit G